jgi:peptide/nickel transport system permease protein
VSVAADPAPTADRGARHGFFDFLRQRPASLLGLAGFGLIVLIALFAPLIAPHDPLKQHLGDNFKPPFWEPGGSPTYPLGTDPLGRDLLSRLIFGARASLFISVGAVILGGTIGFVTGLIAGYAGRWADAMLMRLGDIQLAFPFVLFAIALLAVSPERTTYHLILVLGLSSWVIYARVVRGRVLTEREKEYAWAARALGASRSRILSRHLLPNVWQVIPVIGLLNLGFFVIVESLLSFLALGLTPPAPSWGSILADGRTFMMVSPWMVLLPGIAIVVTVLSVSLAADALTDYVDPKLAHGIFRRTPLPSANPPILSTATGDAPLLQVRDLTTIFPTPLGPVRAVDHVSFTVARGQVLGIVGESGSGKSTLGLSLIQLVDAPGRVTHGEIMFLGRDLARVSNAEMAARRGAQIGMIFQEPSAALNPVLTVGYQLRETLRRHRALTPLEARHATRAALAAVRIPDPERVSRAYPFQLSGGMAQRVMIALAMARQPDLLVLDEPTSALDVTTQAQLLDELRTIRDQSGVGIIFITHDLALLAGFADAIMVMYAGQICERGPRDDVFARPLHPYTRALLAAVQRVRLPATDRLAAIPGDPPDLTRLPPGCPFAPRCPLAQAICTEETPLPRQWLPGRYAACHFALAIAGADSGLGRPRPPDISAPTG